MSTRIMSVETNSRSFTIQLNDEKKKFSWFWLRDHAQDPISYHQQARQRLVETSKLGHVDQPSYHISKDGLSLTLRWDTLDVPICYTADYLYRVSHPNKLYDVIGSERQLWDAKAAGQFLKAYNAKAIVEDEEALRQMLDSVRLVGMAKITDISLEILAARAVMERISYVRSSIFGDMWELKADGKLDDTGSTPLDIAPHTDGTYNHDAPGILSLFCLHYDAVGGDNILVDGHYVLREIQASNQAMFDLLCSAPIPGQYIGDGSYLTAIRPVCRLTPEGEIVQVSYNNHDRAPFHLPEPEMSMLYDALMRFDQEINDARNQFVFSLREGEMIIFDNWRLLHGRRAFQGNRHMVGSYINREDFESRLRILQAQKPLDLVGKF